MAGKFAVLKNSCGAVVAAVVVAGMVPVAASAQSDQRLERIETQLRALQRAVFPGGDERFFQPEITQAPAPANPAASAIPSGTALTDMLNRLSSIETQLARLTAATEVNENSLSLLEMRLAALEQTGPALVSGAGTAASTSPSTSTSTISTPAATGVIPLPGNSAQGAGNAAQAGQTPAPAAAAGPSPARVAAVQAIAKPATGDQGDDEYTYGFRLWDAGFYPEAQQQLALFVEQYPRHSRTTFGRNLLGRAFLDAGDARRAATHFFENYQADKQAARAPDSLLYLAEAMIQLGDTNRACIALAEFGDTYPALATGRLQSQYVANRGRVDCN